MGNYVATGKIINEKPDKGDHSGESEQFSATIRSLTIYSYQQKSNKVIHAEPCSVTDSGLVIPISVKLAEKWPYKLKITE
ncbi:hypothetical protein AB6A40_001199 [Gnathostoma spinigerum]|uniref:Uncharacterized protein n=1 Tax=Gnathostoma spinigerum TaxID=75299 RepID=A0ABD6EDU0_9BILA